MIEARAGALATELKKWDKVLAAFYQEYEQAKRPC
jgi:hypothetical protein